MDHEADAPALIFDGNFSFDLHRVTASNRANVGTSAVYASIATATSSTATSA